MQFTRLCLLFATLFSFCACVAEREDLRAQGESASFWRRYRIGKALNPKITIPELCRKLESSICFPASAQDWNTEVRRLALGQGTTCPNPGLPPPKNCETSGPWYWKETPKPLRLSQSFAETLKKKALDLSDLHYDDLLSAFQALPLLQPVEQGQATMVNQPCTTPAQIATWASRTRADATLESLISGAQIPGIDETPGAAFFTGLTFDTFLFERNSTLGSGVTSVADELAQGCEEAYARKQEEAKRKHEENKKKVRLEEGKGLCEQRTRAAPAEGYRWCDNAYTIMRDAIRNKYARQMAAADQILPNQSIFDDVRGHIQATFFRNDLSPLPGMLDIFTFQLDHGSGYPAGVSTTQYDVGVTCTDEAVARAHQSLWAELLEIIASAICAK